MKMKLLAALFLILYSTNIFAQKSVEIEKLIENERNFAKTAETKNTKQAFLDFLSDDSLMFTPDKVDGKTYWNARSVTSSSLVWYPVFADVSSNGALGYTTGHAELRPEGKTGAKIFYSDFATIWRRQTDGSWKATLDVGISHDKLPSEDMKWSSPKDAETIGENKSPAANSVNNFFDTATTKGLSKAYKTYAADYVRFLREGKLPIIGKNNALAEVGKDKVTFGKNMTLQSAGDLGYVVTSYELKNGDKITEKGNIIQFWKLIGGKWQIVLDVVVPIPLEMKKGNE